MEENLSYSAARMCQVWPSRFRSIESAQPYAHNPRALGNKVYNGRMGNRTGTDDGYAFRGRSLSQCTGREGYERVQKLTGLPAVANPDVLNDPRYALLCGVADFVACGCLPYAKADNVGAVSAALNVGDPRKVSAVVGLAERVAWLKRWKAALGRGPLDLSLPKVLSG
jgi:putative chitinase